MPETLRKDQSDLAESLTFSISGELVNIGQIWDAFENGCELSKIEKIQLAESILNQGDSSRRYSTLSRKEGYTPKELIEQIHLETVIGEETLERLLNRELKVETSERPYGQNTKD